MSGLGIIATPVAFTVYLAWPLMTPVLDVLIHMPLAHPSYVHLMYSLISLHLLGYDYN